MLRIQCECDDLLNSLNCNSSVENQRIKPLPDKIFNRWKTIIYIYIVNVKVGNKQEFVPANRLFYINNI